VDGHAVEAVSLDSGGERPVGRRGVWKVTLTVPRLTGYPMG
jgi:hypothetical protein